MARNTKRVVFHIGFERTGTTSIQGFLCAHGNEILRDGFLYPTRNAGFHGNNHAPLVASYFPRFAHDYFVHTKEISKEDVLASLMREIDASSADTVVISAEHFSSRFRLPQILKLAADFESFDCRIVLWVREPISRFFSAYATQVASGGRLTLDGYADQILLPGNLYARYAETIALWETAFGREAIDIRVHAKDQDTVDVFLDSLGCDGTAKKDRVGRSRDGLSDNRSLGPVATEYLRITNVLVGDVDAPTSLQHRLKRFVQVAVRYSLHKATPFIPHRVWGLDETRLAALNDLAQHDRAWLHAHYGICLPPALGGRAPRAGEGRLRASKRLDEAPSAELPEI